MTCWRNVGGVETGRLAAGLLSLAAIPTVGALSTSGQVAVAAALLGGLVTFEGVSRSARSGGTEPDQLGDA